MGASSSAHGGAVVDFELTGSDGQLYASSRPGSPFKLKGANWFGSEAYNGPPGGLEKHSVGWLLDYLASHNFNAIRLLFAHEYVEKNDIVHAPAEEPLLFQVRYIDMFIILVREAAKRGILVMIACHRIKHDAWPGKGLWYDLDLGWTVERVERSWSTMAAALCSEWNVIAADLVNEPHGSSWAKGRDIDWNLGAERLGNHVLDECQRWLIFVEGVGYDPEPRAGRASRCVRCGVHHSTRAAACVRATGMIRARPAATTRARASGGART